MKNGLSTQIKKERKKNIKKAIAKWKLFKLKP